MAKIKIEPLSEAYKLLNPGCVVLISVGGGEKDNLFSVTWNMPVKKDPGMVAILSGRRHYSYGFIEKTGQFAVNIPSREIAEAVLGCGRTTGTQVPDKFGRFCLTRMKADEIKAPLVEEAVANLECQVSQVVDLGPSSLLIARIVAARADDKHFKDGKWRFNNGLSLLHHLGDDSFAVTEKQIEVKRP